MRQSATECCRPGCLTVDDQVSGGILLFLDGTDGRLFIPWNEAATSLSEKKPEQPEQLYDAPADQATRGKGQDPCLSHASNRRPGGGSADDSCPRPREGVPPEERRASSRKGFASPGQFPLTPGGICADLLNTKALRGRNRDHDYPMSALSNQVSLGRKSDWR